jgi:chemotaxis protein CheX
VAEALEIRLTVKAKYVNPFLAASLNLFRDHLGIAVRSLAPFVRKDPTSLEEVSGIIGLAGETVGAVVLSFSRETAMAVVSALSGRQYGALTNEVLDGVGEMVNIIAGNAKKDLLDFRISISLPGVIVGAGSRIHWPEGIPVITIPFETDVGNVSVNVSLREAL